MERTYFGYEELIASGRLYYEGFTFKEISKQLNISLNLLLDNMWSIKDRAEVLKRKENC